MRRRGVSATFRDRVKGSAGCIAWDAVGPVKTAGVGAVGIVRVSGVRIAVNRQIRITLMLTCWGMTIPNEDSLSHQAATLWGRGADLLPVLFSARLRDHVIPRRISVLPVPWVWL